MIRYITAVEVPTYIRLAIFYTIIFRENSICSLSDQFKMMCSYNTYPI